MPDDSNDETLRTETTPDPRRPQREMSTFKVPAQRFTLGEELGRGGMGQVIAARDVSLKRGVAIKKVLSTNEVDLERFDREVRITAELEHPSIVPIHDVGLDDEGRPFYVMRQIRGEPLSKRLATLSTLRARLAVLPNLLSVTDAAAFAHARRILHRDIKPANILLGSFGETLLIDWGLARRFDEIEPKIPEAADSLPGGTLTVAGYVYGTPGYMAPEQARGEVVDARADVFALGATLFHLLVGRGPYEGMSAGDRMQAAVDDVPAPFELIPADAPGELRAIVGKAMAVDPARRYPDAGALAADLRAFLEGQLVGAHQYTLGERVRRFVRRHRAALAVAALAMIALVVGGVFALLRVIDEQRETALAQYKAKAAQLDVQDRKDRLIVEQASASAETDPVRAILYLRELSEKSPYMAHARDVAAKAAAHGLPTGDHAHTEQVTALSLAPDGRSLASGDRTGRVVVRELAAKNPRTLAELGTPVLQIAWLDATTLVTTAKQGLARFSVPADSRDILAGEYDVGTFAIAEPPDRIRFVDRKTKQLVELVLATNATRVIARDVELVLGRGERIAVSGPGGVRWWTPDNEISLSPIAPRVEFNLALSPDGERLALAGVEQVFVWDAVGRELGRWMVKYAIRPFFGPDTPYVLTMRGAIVRLGDEARDMANPRLRMIGSARTSVGTAIALETGGVLLADGASVRNVPLHMTQAVLVEGRSDSPILVMGSRTGAVEWWNVGEIAPPAMMVGQFRQCTVDAREVYVFLDSRLVAIDRTTQVQRDVLAFEYLAVADCLGVTTRGQIVLATTGFGGNLIDSRTGERRRVSKDWIGFDPDNDAVLISRGAELLQIDHGVGEPRVLFTAASPIMSIEFGKRHIAARLEDGRLQRFDRETAQLTDITAFPGKYLVTDGGEVWYSTLRWLWRWTEHGAHPVAEFSSDIVELGSDGNPLYVLLADRTSWIAFADRRTRELTNVGKLLWVGRHGSGIFDFDGKLLIYKFAHDERIERTLPEAATVIRLALGERAIVVRLGPGYLVTFVDDVPDDPAALVKWLDAATNAELDPTTQVIRWRTTASPRTPRAP